MQKWDSQKKNNQKPLNCKIGVSKARISFVDSIAISKFVDILRWQRCLFNKSICCESIINCKPEKAPDLEDLRGPSSEAPPGNDNETWQQISKDPFFSDQL